MQLLLGLTVFGVILHLALIIGNDLLGRSRKALTGSLALGNRFPSFAIVKQHPIIDAVFAFARLFDGLGEQFPQELVIGGFLETEFANILEINAKLFGVVIAQIFDSRALLLLADFFVLLLVGSCFNTLPRKSATQEVHEHMAKGFKIIATRLLCPDKKKKKK